VSNEHLRDNFKNHFRSKFFSSRSVSQEAKRVFEELNIALKGVNLINFDNKLLSSFIKNLSFVLIRLSLSEEKRKPVSEAFISGRSAHLLFSKRTQTKEILSGLNTADLTSAGESRNRDSNS